MMAATKPFCPATPRCPSAMTDHCGFYWVLKGRLAGSAYPTECLDWLYHKQGIRALVSLEPLAPDEARHATHLGFELANVSITDFTPGTSEQRQAALTHIDRFLERGLPTLVHCKGGLGRTGMILAIYLVTHMGLEPQAAIKQIRHLRSRAIELPEQADAVYDAARSD
jgi:atypical dual specificity phosphatase